MSDVVSDLAAKCGLTPEQAQKGLGAILSFVKKSVPQEDFAKVNEAVPNAEQMMAAAGPHEESSGGVLGAITGMASKLFGGSEQTTALVNKLAGLGLSAEQAQAFLPRVMEFLQTRLPESVMKKISGLFPVPQETATS
jgi:hypothetical protein